MPGRCPDRRRARDASGSPEWAAAAEGATRLEVEDTGPGISPAFLPHVFDRFRQQDASVTREHGGLGLGLSIVRHIVELYGGRVTARNRPDGAGAVFTVILPAVGATASDASRSPAAV